MKFWKQSVLFYMGGLFYFCLELGWRRRSHGSMFLLGGLCFLLVGGGASKFQKIPIPVRPLLGAAVITGLELVTGLLVNRDHSVWDYRDQLYQLDGQICLAFSLLWVPVSLASMELYAVTQKKLAQKME